MKDMKKAVSAILTVLMTAALAATVYAVDYGAPPAIDPVSASASAASEDVQSAIKEVASGDINGTATVDVKSTAILPVSSSAIKALKSSKDGVLEIKSPKATISIDASTIKKVTRVDLSSKIYGSDKRMIVEFRASAKKKFNCEVKIVLTSCKMSAERLANAKLYCDGEVVDGGLEINEDGLPVITVTTGGKYEIR